MFGKIQVLATIIFSFYFIVLYFWFLLLGLSGIVGSSTIPIKGVIYFFLTHFLSFTPNMFAISVMLLGVLQNSNTFSWGVTWGEDIDDWG